MTKPADSLKEETLVMTMRTRNAIVCECGHDGHILCKENDAPYSAMYEDYSLEGFDGGTVNITSFKERPDDMIAALKPTCPECGQTGQVTYSKAK